jgi:hypothetical protein
MYVTAHHAIRSGSGHLTDAAQSLVDQTEIVDALYRFGLAQDLRYRPGSRELFMSAFAKDAVLDFRPAARTCGLEVPLMEGRDMITSIILDPRTRIDTTHVVTNPRIVVDGETAHLSAIVEAQHLPTDDHSRHALLKNLYDVQLRREGSRWVMTRVVIDCVWFTGDPRVITGN